MLHSGLIQEPPSQRGKKRGLKVLYPYGFYGNNVREIKVEIQKAKNGDTVYSVSTHGDHSSDLIKSLAERELSFFALGLNDVYFAFAHRRDELFFRMLFAGKLLVAWYAGNPCYNHIRSWTYCSATDDYYYEIPYYDDWEWEDYELEAEEYYSTAFKLEPRAKVRKRMKKKPRPTRLFYGQNAESLKLRAPVLRSFRRGPIWSSYSIARTCVTRFSWSPTTHRSNRRFGHETRSFASRRACSDHREGAGAIIPAA